jgi:hypothetical protein
MLDLESVNSSAAYLSFNHYGRDLHGLIGQPGRDELQTRFAAFFDQAGQNPHSAVWDTDQQAHNSICNQPAGIVYPRKIKVMLDEFLRKLVRLLNGSYDDDQPVGLCLLCHAFIPQGIVSFIIRHSMLQVIASSRYYSPVWFDLKIA